MFVIEFALTEFVKNNHETLQIILCRGGNVASVSSSDVRGIRIGRIPLKFQGGQHY